MSYKILCTDGLSQSGLLEITESDILELESVDTLQHDELIKKIGVYDGLIVRSASKVSRDVIEAGKKLRLIARAGVGTDNIDLEAATEHGIFVINAPSGNTISTAELTFAMILALSRHIPQAAGSMVEGRWDRKKFKGSEVAYKTLGIIGLGRIGREVASRAKSFRMNVVGFDPHLSDEQLESIGVKPLTKDELVKSADFITVHTPLTEKTENMIAKREFSTMKPSARVINCARGGIINEEDLADALRKKTIAGAALDVYSKEPFDSSAFKDIPNCIMTPHLGASTVEAQDAVASEIASYVSRFFREGTSSTAVNLPASGADADQFSQHIMLAGNLGSLASQLLNTKADRVTFYSASKYPSLVMISALEGVLANSTKDKVTLINAVRQAKQCGISIVEELIDQTHESDGAFGIKVSGEGRLVEIWGAIFDDGTLKVVKFDDYRVEIDPVGSILFVKNEDRPGMIGRICSILGDEGVNIAEMQNVRKKPGADALTIIGVDGLVSQNTLNRIEGEDGIGDVRYVSL